MNLSTFQDPNVVPHNRIHPVGNSVSISVKQHTSHFPFSTKNVLYNFNTVNHMFELTAVYLFYHEILVKFFKLLST